MGVHAEEVGFEPTVSCPTHTFQACRFGRFRTPPDEPLRSVLLPGTSEHRAPRIVQCSDGVWQLFGGLLCLVWLGPSARLNGQG